MKTMIAVVLSFVMLTQTAFATVSQSDITVNQLSQKMSAVVAASATDAQKKAEIAKIHKALSSLSTTQKIAIVDSLIVKLQHVKRNAWEKEAGNQGIYFFAGITVTAFVILYAATKGSEAMILTTAASALLIGTLIYRQELNKEAVLKNANEMETALKNLRQSLLAQAQAEALG